MLDPGSCIMRGQIYESGTVFQKNCMKFFCENSTWYSSNKYNAECKFSLENTFNFLLINHGNKYKIPHKKDITYYFLLLFQVN